ncbi:MAG: ATP-binding protein [Acidobacteriia bacterium]|nr:ATP-binding protein [Terriglobia bacterium]
MAPVRRDFWLERINRAWTDCPIVWLSGVRRVGKTTLARMLPAAIYMNCDLPSTGRLLRDPELFLDGHESGTVLVFDEVHRLEDPSRLLKIVADEYPGLRVLATGSSTLAATRKFRDTLTGRKRSVHLPPVLWEECNDWLGGSQLDRRLYHGGLPQALLADSPSADFFGEWIDSFYARDIQELFQVRSRSGFQALFRLLLRQSGGQIDHTRLATLCQLSRPTVRSYIEAMTITHALHLVRSYHGAGKREIVARPKCYGFDTGLVCFERGWTGLRREDRGLLWEHLVLDAVLGLFGDGRIFYWRDKAGREVDFVIRREGNRVDALECKINPDHLNRSALSAFRSLYPEGRNYIVSPAVRQHYSTRERGLTVTVCDTPDLADVMGLPRPGAPPQQ